MYKNIIFVLSDAIAKLDDTNFKEHFTLLDEMKENVIYYNNMFSQGPYTEAAINVLLSSTNCLDYKGYMNNLKYKPYTINEIFKEQGYKTFNSLWYYPNTESFLRGVDEYYYVDSQQYEFLNLYRIDYFRELYVNNKFESIHLKELEEIINDYFLGFNRYIQDYNKKGFELLNKYGDLKTYDFDLIKNIILNENKSFNKDRKKYLLELLEGKRKQLENIQKVHINQSNSYIKRKKAIENKCKQRCIKQFFYLIKNNKKNKSLDILKKAITFAFVKRDYKIFQRAIMYTINFTGKPIYNNISSGANLDYIKEYLVENKDQNNFIFYHAMDTHFPFNFFSNEINDEEVIEEEYKVFKDYMDNKHSNSIFYDLSIRYVNDKLKKFIDDLKENKLLEDTLIIFTSDHGSSYTGEIFRETKVSTCYDENYKVPFVLYNPTLNGKTIDKLSSSIDVIPTILDYVGIDFRKYNLDGKSLLKEENKYITFEYMGSGCPDMHSKKKTICIRSNELKIVTMVDKNNKEINVIEIYDLTNDPRELDNVIEKLIDNTEVKSMLGYLEKRLKEIK
ncbi:MAG: sulfatase-like hydrolase/transferase [Clostridiales bacterium]|nr:sulfatase-like hydrolase/transferase [Clostridiales bacterium]